MPPVCKTCKHQDVEQINTLLVEGASLRNIASRMKGISYNSVKRHRDKCISALFAEKTAERHTELREGLLADIDEIKQEIREAKADFIDNGSVRAQLIQRRLDVVDKEAKLTGAYTKDRENPISVAHIAQAVLDQLIAQGHTPEAARAFVQSRYQEISAAVN